MNKYEFEWSPNAVGQVSRLYDNQIMIPLRYTHNSLYNLAYTIYEPNRVDSSRMLPPPLNHSPLRSPPTACQDLAEPKDRRFANLCWENL
ncbi:hypothetical protein ACLKA7_012716 [Drosophila subpalustris]